MSYPGGKAGAGVYQTLINLMPPHDVYIEPFLGGGAIMRTKRPAAVNIGIDIDRTALEVATMPAGSPWQAMRPGHSGSEVFAPAPVAVFGDGWKRFEFHQEDSIDFLRHIELRPSALVYADPPYLRMTRVTSRDLYANEMTDAQHLELLSVLKALPCRVMISGYSSALYARELKGWHCTAFQAATRGKPAAEWVWCNYPRPVELHDYRFLGDDFRQREQIKRMEKRWVAKLKKMEPLKRQALLAAIAATNGNGDPAAQR